MRFFYKFILILIIPISCIGHKADNRFIITYNNSKTEIYCFFLEHNLNNIKGLSKFDFYQKSVNPYKESSDHVNKLTWEEYIKTCDNQKIRYYIIKKDSVDKYGWKKIFNKNIYNKKYLFTIEDLDKINWEIEYKGE